MESGGQGLAPRPPFAILIGANQTQEGANLKMPKRNPGLTLDSKGNDFIMRRTTANGRTAGITLSDDDVLTLAQSAPLLRNRILSKRTPGGGSVSAVFVTPVVQIHLTVDVLEENILLTMIDRSGAQTAFSLPDDIARHIAERIPEHLARVRAKKPTKQ
jgi:hypothetical protein